MQTGERENSETIHLDLSLLLVEDFVYLLLTPALI